MTSGTPSKKVNFISLGCAKNLVDSEKLVGLLKAGGYEVAFESSEPNFDTVIINTCGFINDAKEESVDVILHYADLKNRGVLQKLLVMGCLSERYKKELKTEITEIDALFGVNDFVAVCAYLQTQSTHKYYVREITTPPHYAYLKISEGCSRQCAFCAIPMIRGRHISLPEETLIEEAKHLVSRGVKEINIIAQDTTYYGLDLYGERRLGKLLKAISRIDGLEWLRVNYTYPQAFPKDVLDIMAAEEKICNYIDMPLQHINNEVLKSMKRGINKAATIKLLQDIRHKLPDVTLRTSFIVGYPTETPEAFEELYEFVEEVQFDRVGVFKYSHEEQTPAYKLTDKVSATVKEKRYNKLMSLQQEISLQKNSQKCGEVVKVLIDSTSDGSCVGRTCGDAPDVDNDVVIKTAKELRPGTFCMVRISDADAYTLYGTPESLK